MEIIKVKNGIQINNVKDLDLDHTLDCGQAFRWKKIDNNGYSGVVRDKSVTVYLKDTVLTILGATEEDYKKLWYNYFDMDMDYSILRKEFAEIHPIMKEATKYAHGIRLLNQDSWEALCSFIISQNNNILRIKGIIDRFSTTFGNKISGNNYSFPTAQCVAKLRVEDLVPIRSGFRAKYIIDAATKVATKQVDLEKVKAMPTEEAREELMKIKGVGPKVADCTLLFGMHKLECFPMDVWMKRAMKELFPNLTPQDFGKYSGVAQQYIFHYSRMNPNIFK